MAFVIANLANPPVGPRPDATERGTYIVHAYCTGRVGSETGTAVRWGSVDCKEETVEVQIEWSCPWMRTRSCLRCVHMAALSP